jgi:hypothetical protein
MKSESASGEILHGDLQTVRVHCISWENHRISCDIDIYVNIYI